MLVYLGLRQPSGHGMHSTQYSTEYISLYQPYREATDNSEWVIISPPPRRIRYPYAYQLYYALNSKHCSKPHSRVLLSAVSLIFKYTLTFDNYNNCQV